jgi:PKD repeat protein
MKNIKNKKLVYYAGMVIVATLLISASVTPVFSDSTDPVGDRLAKFIAGDSQKCGTLTPPTTGSPVTVTSSQGTKTGSTLSDGTFQVSISGVPPDPDWPDGTTFTVTITDGSWSGSKSGTVSGTVTDVGMVTLYPPAPVATASANPTTVLVGETVNFYGSATGGSTPYSWDWDFGDGTTHSSLQNPTHSYSTTGTKTVVLTVTDNCGTTDTDTVTITVNPPLSCDAGGPYSGTICTTVSFSGTASGGVSPYSYSWNFGDGGSGSGPNPTHQYTADGSYTATLTVTDSNSDTAQDTAPVTISTPAVVADAGGPYSGTICSPISFSGSASGGCIPYSWSWSFGDGGTSTLQNPTHQYASDGTYTATLTVTDNKGASDSDTASVSVSTSDLVADASGPSSGCTGDPVSFSGSATGGCSPYSYSWSFGDGGSSTQQNPSHTFNNPGTYTVTLTVTDNIDQTDSDTISIIIEDCLLNVDAHGPYYGTVGIAIQFTGSVSGGTPPYYYQWSFGDGSISENQNPTHVYSSPSPSGGYPVVLYVSDSGGTHGNGYTRAYIDPGDTPVANAGGPYTGIVNQTVEFTGSASGGASPYTFSWDLDNDGEFDDATGSDAEWSWDAAGSYTIGLKVVDDNGQEDTDDATVTITEPGTNNPPNKPAKPSGKINGKTDTPYTYTTSTTDPDEDQISYLFDWGDGTDSGWVGPYDSGATGSATHTWTSKGSYEIKVKAKDTNGAESDWSDPLAVSMPKIRGVNFLLFNFLENHPLLYQLLERFFNI